MIITFYLAFEVRIKKIHVWSLYSPYTLQMLAFLSFFLFQDFFFNSNHNSRMKLFFSLFLIFFVLWLVLHFAKIKTINSIENLTH